MSRSSVVRLAAAMLCLVVVTGCNPVYLAQAVRGQAQLLGARRPVPQVLADPATDAHLRGRLDAASRALRFAHEALALPDNGSYRDYAHLDRPYAVWNVFAAPEFSLRLRTWCFPVAGCVAYRGYFEEADARVFAARLAARGDDVFVAGAVAYSTLGFFRDPLTSSALRLPEDRVAGLVFHELAHQRLYVGDDTVFNESFATLVEEEGLIRWLGQQADSGALCRYLDGLQRERQVRALLVRARASLGRAYAATVPVEQRRDAKAVVLEELRARYRELRVGWGGPPYFDAWFDGELNNASLGALAAYDELVGTLRVILESEGGDLPAFYRRAERLGRLGRTARGEVLREIRSVSEPAAAGRDCRAGSTGSAGAAGSRSRGTAVSIAPAPG